MASLGSQKRDLIVRIDAETKGFEGGMQKSSVALRGMQGELRKLEQKQRAQHQAMTEVGKASLAAGAAMATGVGLAVRAAAQWESAFAGVLKTASTDDPLKLGQLEADLRQLARTLPASHKEIAAVAEAAGQLGVQTQNVAAFTKVMVDLGETTNLSADEAATSLAQMMNIMQSAPEDIGRLGAALVELGNNGASTERDIMEMALRISGAGKQVGMAESDVLAMANAMASVGINAEAGGSAISRFMVELELASQQGGTAMSDFADVAGMSVGEFSTLFEDDAAKAIGAFTDGLGEINASGGSAIKTLDDMGIKEIRLRDTLLRLAGAQGIVNASVDLGREAWEANVALVDEANKRYATTEAKMQIAKNSVNDLAIGLGTTLLPALAGVATGLADFAGWLADLPQPLQDAAMIVGTLGAVILTAGGLMLLAVPKVLALKSSVDALAASAPRAAAAMGLLGKATVGLGIAGAVVGIAVALDQLQKSMNDVEISGDEWTKQLRGMTDGSSEASEVARLLGDDFSKLGETIDAANNNKLSLIDGRGIEEVEYAREVTKGLDAALAGLVTSGNADEAQAMFDRMSAAAVEQGRSVDEVAAAFPQYGDAMLAVTNANESSTQAAQDLALAVSGIDKAFDNAYSSLPAWTAAKEMDADQTKAVTDQVKGWAEALADFVQPLGAYTDVLKKKTEDEEARAQREADAQNESVDAKIKAVQREYDARLDAARKVEGVSDQTIQTIEDERDAALKALDEQKNGRDDYVKAVEVSVSEYLGELERQVQAQEAHADNMKRLAGRVSSETLNELAKLGPDGAPLVANLVSASDEELSKLDDLFRRRTAEATGQMAAEIFLAQELLPQIAKTLGTDVAMGLAQGLASGTHTVAGIFDEYAWAIQGGLAPLMESLGKPLVMSLVKQERAMANRSSIRYAEGGFEDHSAQIAPAGAWRVWAEPETGGEAYIPLAPSKRQRSVGIWQETGRRLGVFASGGFWTPDSVPAPYSTSPYGPPVSSGGDTGMDTLYQAARGLVRSQMEQGGSGGSAAGLLPIMAAARQYVMDTYGVRNIGGFARRNIAGTNKLSDHARGKAIDVMTSNLARGWAIANDFAFGEAGKRFRAENVIWQQSISSRGGPFRGMADRGSATQNHRDHVHIDTFAKGGILNPHVRDSGGPLLPGFTFNGTGRPEMVLPMAGGGIVSGGAVRPGGPSLTTTTRSMTDISQIRRTVAAWEDYARSLDQAARKRALVAAAQEAAREVARAEAESGTAGAAAAKAQAKAKEAETRATVVLANARRRLQQAKSASARENAQAAVAEARRKLAVVRESGATKVSEANARAAKDATDDLRQARERLADANRAVKDFDFAAARDRESAAVDRLVDKLEREAEVRKQLTDIRDEQKSRLDDMLDAEKAARDKGVDAAREFAERETEIGRKRVAAEVQFRKQSAQAAKDYAKVQEQFRADSSEAARDLQAQQKRLLDARRDQLDGWARLDQVATASWGNTVDQLLGNARDQAEQFEEWIASLADARRRGVSEQVIASLGLDEGPQALGQLRQFGQATASEIDALNVEVARRTVLAAQQTSREQRNGYGALGRDLVAAQQQYADAITGLQQRFAAAQQDYAQSVSDLQARFAEDQAALDEELVRAQSELLVRQAEVANELAAVGQQQGRSYGESLAQGLRSQIPAVVAAAQTLMAAAKNASAAGANLPGVGLPGAPPKGTAGYVSANGQQLHVNKVGIIDTRGDYYGKYPTQVAQQSVPVVNARIFIGDRELTDMVDVRVQTTLSERRDAALSFGRR